MFRSTRRGLRVEQLESRQLLAVDYVVHISFDGLGGPYLQPLIEGEASSHAGDYANYLKLTTQGAFTYNARTDFTNSVTLPNHASMLTGRPVLPPNATSRDVSHNWTINSDPAPTMTLHNNHPDIEYIASVFDVAHDEGLSTAFYATKTKFSLFTTSYNDEHGAPDTNPTGGDNGRNKMDEVLVHTNIDVVMDELIADIQKQGPANYTFFHSLNPDTTGHTFGWGTEEWQESVKRTDQDLGRIMSAIEASPTMNGRTAIILTTDHGGSAFSHAEPDVVEHYTIPFFVWGPGIPAGQDLYDLYLETTADPGTSRPDYNAEPQPIRNGDSGNLALELLGLPNIPGSTINHLTDGATENHSPVFRPIPTFSVREDVAVGTIVGSVLADDPDGDALTYAFTGGDDGVFGINATTGQITTTSALDFETQSSHRLELRVTDTAGLLDTASVTINVIDVTENHSPVFRPIPTFSAREDVAVGTIAGSVLADDPDGDALTYAFTGGDDGVFGINSESGQITTTSALDFETRSSYRLELRVTDTAGLFDTASVTINVIDVTENHSPVFRPIPTFSVREDVAVGTIAGSVLADDPDGDTLMYEITNGNDGVFGIDAATGQITTNSSFDNDSPTSYLLELRVSDTVGLFDTASATVDVIDSSENRFPAFQSTPPFSVREDEAVGAVVGSVQADDPDGDALTYEVTSGSDGAFGINAATGQITVRGGLDFETRARYVVGLRVADTRGGSDTIDVTINVIDVSENRPPVFRPVPIFRVREDVSVGANVGTVIADDPNHDEVTYALIGTNDAFRIDPETGQITISQALDFETREGYVLVIRAADTTGQFDTASVTVHVIDVLENRPPTFHSLPILRLPEDAAGGANVGTVVADDPDGDTLTYGITGGNDGTFRVHATTGRITTARALDAETRGNYQLEVRATDTAGLFDTVNVTIHVTPVTASWQNAIEPADVNDDGILSPLDALLVINELIARRISSVETGAILESNSHQGQSFVDVDDDGFVLPVDALLVINELARTTAPVEASLGSAKKMTPSAAATSILNVSESTQHQFIGTRLISNRGLTLSMARRLRHVATSNRPPNITSQTIRINTCPQPSSR